MEERLQNNKTGFALKTQPNPELPMTSEELAFLIHFVGDIHQPLHASNNGDRGGNCVSLTSPLAHSDGSRPTTELHAVWDVNEVVAVLNALGGEAATAEALFQRFKRDSSVPQLGPVDWARESNDLARKDVYEKLSIPGHRAAANRCFVVEPVAITEAYLTGNVPDVETQLMKAGIRLSNILNEICGGSGCEVDP